MGTTVTIILHSLMEVSWCGKKKWHKALFYNLCFVFKCFQMRPYHEMLVVILPEQRVLHVNQSFFFLLFFLTFVHQRPCLCNSLLSSSPAWKGQHDPEDAPSAALLSSSFVSQKNTLTSQQGWGHFQQTWKKLNKLKLSKIRTVILSHML